MSTIPALPAAYHRFAGALAAALGVFWLWLAIDPADRPTWVLENVLFVVFVGALALGYRRLVLSRLSYALIFVFLCLHTIGAHYTYSLVPYDEWSQVVTGWTVSEVMGWERNHYDRVVHFLFGALLAYPAREVLVRVAGVRGFWGYAMPLLLMMSFSLVYELLEWAAALAFGGDLGIHFLGTQGDQWDGHRDMALASLGALGAMTVTAAVNAALQRDFVEEWHESLRVKQAGPLGEVAIAEMLEQRRAASGDTD
jgi:putative membrane protein